MDGMALLCNLHADGPETLRSLREEGCTTLEQLRELGVERLSSVLGFTPAAARRFLREGRLLLERMEGGGSPSPGLEGEESLEAPTPAPVLRTALASDLPDREQALLSRVLERWHELDPQGEEALRTAPRVEPEGEPLDSHDPDLLRPGALELLDLRTCAALRAHGIETLPELAGRTPDEIGRASGLPFTSARKLQFLARRALAADVLPAREPAPRRGSAEEKISLAFPDLSSPPPVAPFRPARPRPASAPRGELDAAGGPFA